MTRKWFEQTDYNGKIAYETYQQCDCSICKRENCIHREAYRRMPKEVGGLGECPNLKAKYKLKVYKNLFQIRGKFDHDEYFETKEEMDERYEKFMSYRMGEPLPTAWKLVCGVWMRMEGY